MLLARGLGPLLVLRGRPTLSRQPLLTMARRNETQEEREARKVQQKVAKQAKRLERQGLGDSSAGQKACTLCGRGRDLLIRQAAPAQQPLWEDRHAACPEAAPIHVEFVMLLPLDLGQFIHQLDLGDMSWLSIPNGRVTRIKAASDSDTAQ